VLQASIHGSHQYEWPRINPHMAIRFVKTGK
jgi:hypothetical protein